MGRKAYWVSQRQPGRRNALLLGIDDPVFLFEGTVLMRMILGNCIGIIVFCFLLNLITLCSPCRAATVALSWEANTEPTLAGYRVYYKSGSSLLPFDGTEASEGGSPIDVRNSTTTTVSGLFPDKSYYFTVTAYDSLGVESDYSRIVYVPGTDAIKADVNGDGIVGLTDAMMALQFAAGNMQPAPDQFVRADVAPIAADISVPNGIVDVGDVIVILGIVTGRVILK